MPLLRALVAEPDQKTYLRVYGFETLADTYARLGQHEEARAAYATVDELTKYAPVDSVRTRQHLYTGLGRLDEAEGNGAGAEAYYERAIALTEQLFAERQRTQGGATVLHEGRVAYRSLAALYVRQGRTEEALRLLDQTQARYLRTLDGLRSQGQSVQRAGTSDAAAEQLRQARQDSAAYKGLDVLALQQHLARSERGETLVSYFFHDAEGYAFVVRPDTFVCVPLGISADSVRTLTRTASALWAGQPVRTGDTQFDLRPLHHLYKGVFAPLIPWIDKGKPVVVVPDGPLRTVPFSMLVASPVRRFDYLECRLSAVPSHLLDGDCAIALHEPPARDVQYRPDAGAGAEPL